MGHGVSVKMTLILSVLAGAIGASWAAGTWPRMSLVGAINILFGLIGGVAVWAAAYELSLLAPNFTVLLSLLVLGGLGGALLTLGAGSLRNIVLTR